MNNLDLILIKSVGMQLRLDDLNSKRAVSLITTLREFWHHDAIIAIAGLALVVSFFALLASRRANTIAAQAQAEHGKIKDLRIEFVVSTLEDRRAVWRGQVRPCPRRTPLILQK